MFPHSHHNQTTPDYAEEDAIAPMTPEEKQIAINKALDEMLGAGIGG